MKNKSSSSNLHLSACVLAKALGVVRRLRDEGRSAKVGSLICALALAAPALAFNPQPEPPGSAAVGVTAGQTAVTHVSYTQPPRDTPPDPCIFTLHFFDAAGEQLFATAGALRPGATFSAELPPLGGLLGVGERLVLRAMVHFTDPDRRVREACGAATKSALELFDTETGRAGVVMGFVPCTAPPDLVSTK